MKFRKKPVVIDAFHLEGEYEKSDGFAAYQWMDNFDGLIPRVILNSSNIVIRTLEGDMKALYGDWIIRGINGEFYPCQNDIFLRTYEEVVD